MATALKKNQCRCAGKWPCVKPWLHSGGLRAISVSNWTSHAMPASNHCRKPAQAGTLTGPQLDRSWRTSGQNKLPRNDYKLHIYRLCKAFVSGGKRKNTPLYASILISDSWFKSSFKQHLIVLGSQFAVFLLILHYKFDILLFWYVGLKKKTFNDVTLCSGI